ncbi:MAG: hypothetical protein OS130_13780 [Thermodesulfobacteriota bacterium]|jgi:bifunctional DNA-binding transcriptional regulator/antitoxin component of YhaV-PrlF toxin-antitoxin module|nr:MAG: hypothetical protein OS130_13780 [Thermodesulfobacteriota bacterium]
MQKLIVEKDGKVELPVTLRRRWGLDSGTTLLVSETHEGILLRPSDPSLTKVYTEPTFHSNLFLI